ncbi:Wzz/FepE/Etk N-terminal domain-containing protein [Calidithermus timidus]|jgi:uncharacterized protein involved in exopolysaccharide biosynthesis|uniref:Wzz/FepE/Etk N-terminal domain-containing protein n=1 Tax=Calidithermus timidus TaxID=307124 RepID=UPI0003A5360F|nr:Wzz/FepE/Etk N-terminal domain-containing protein [Calidithermus timidus]
MEPHTQSDELSLRDLYLVLKRRQNLILGLTLGAAILVFAVSQVWPKTYSSKVVLSLSFNNQLQSGVLSNLPSLPGLAQGFVDLQNTTLLAKDLGVDQPPEVYGARFDEKKGLLNLSAKGRTPNEARQRVERIVRVATDYLRARMVEGAVSNIRALLAQTQLDLESTQESLKRIQAELKNLSAEGRSDAAIAAALEARQVGPETARSSSPAFTSLSLDESRLRSTAAQLQARIDTLAPLLDKPEQLSQLVGQALQVQVLVPPAEPLRPTSPRPLLYAAIAGVLGLLVGVFWAFLAEALALPQAEGVGQRDTRVVAGPK